MVSLYRNAPRGQVPGILDVLAPCRYSPSIMEFKLTKTKVEAAATNLLVVSTAGSKIKRGSALDRLDKQFKGSISRILRAEDFKGKTGDAKLIHTHGQLPCDVIMVLGIEHEDKGELSPNQAELIRRAAAVAGRTANQRQYKTMSFDLSGWHRKGAKEADQVQAVVEGMEMGTYRFVDYKNKLHQSQLSIKQ